MLSHAALTFLLCSHLPNEVQGPISVRWNGVGILHPSADGETGELYICFTFVSHTYFCPMRVSPRFPKSGVDEQLSTKRIAYVCYRALRTILQVNTILVDNWWTTFPNKQQKSKLGSLFWLKTRKKRQK